MDRGVSHEPSIATRAKVRSLASFGHPQKEIAAYLDITHETLNKYYKEELTQALSDSIEYVKGKLFEQIEAGDVKAMTVFLARRGGWKSADKVAELESLEKLSQQQTLESAQSKIADLTAKKEQETDH